MEEKLFDLVGLGIPFYMAAATYGVFSWLDSNASDEATQVISSWLRGRSHNKPDLGNLIINAFDRVYTSPLLRFRAFRRSATISTIIWFLVIFVPFLSNLAGNWNETLKHPVPSVPTIFLALFLTVISDYISLPFVRWFLGLAQTYPIRASIISSIAGLAVVTTSFFVLLYLTILLIEWYFDVSADILIWALKTQLQTFLLGLIELMSPAFIIHLWLPLFALSSLAVKFVFLIFRAVEWAQWFLKQGDAHPFRAIGIVATIIVFGSAMLGKEAWTLL